MMKAVVYYCLGCLRLFTDDCGLFYNTELRKQLFHPFSCEREHDMWQKQACWGVFCCHVIASIFCVGYSFGIHKVTSHITRFTVA